MMQLMGRTTQQTPRGEKHALMLEPPANEALSRESLEFQEKKEEDEMFRLEPEMLAEDAYSMGITDMVRFSHYLSRSRDFQCVRSVHFACSLGVLWLVMIMQIGLLMAIDTKVVEPAVFNTRIVYDHYEKHMYDHYFFTINGKHRGNGTFHPERFDTLDFRIKEKVCRIQFSHPYFFMAVLFIWTLTCAGELQKTLVHGQRLLWCTPTVFSMRDTIVPYTRATGENTDEVVGITACLKVAIFLVLFVRLFVTIVLLYLGCRWLAATESYTNVLLNAVALEFILLLKELVYYSTTPAHNRRETERTFFQPLAKREEPTWCQLVVPFSWGAACITWVMYYTYRFQMVLPHYKWDVWKVCETLLKDEGIK